MRTGSIRVTAAGVLIASVFLCGPELGSAQGAPVLAAVLVPDNVIDVHGPERTPHPVIVRAAGLELNPILTPSAFARALRRLGDLPVAARTRMEYAVADGGATKIDVFVVEHRVAPRGRAAVGALAVRAALLDEVRVNVAGAFGGGELASAAWRWSANRPKVALGLALPSPHFFAGILSFDVLWERQAYGGVTPSAEAVTLVRDERRRVGLHAGDWSSGWLHWQAGAAIDRMRAQVDVAPQPSITRDYLATDGTLTVRPAGDHVALEATGSWWTPFAAESHVATGGLLAAWRSSNDATHASWFTTSEITDVSRVAPLALWPGAGTGEGRSGLLRAHRLLSDGVLTGAVFGRTVAYASLEHARPVARTRAGVLMISGFVDTARAWHRLNAIGTSPLFVDAGVGLRLQGSGPGGGVRVNVARGLRGGGTTLSASWDRAWPR